MNKLIEALSTFRDGIEHIACEMESVVAGEKLSGNPVKLAEAQGQMVAYRIMVNAMNDFIVERTTKESELAQRLGHKDYLEQMARTVRDKLPDNYGFLLLAAPYGENGRLVYVSTMERAGALNLLKEFLLKAGAAEDWMQHIK
jgi:hypothetical protein